MIEVKHLSGCGETAVLIDDYALWRFQHMGFPLSARDARQPNGAPVEAGVPADRCYACGGSLVWSDVSAVLTR